MVNVTVKELVPMYKADFKYYAEMLNKTTEYTAIRLIEAVLDLDQGSDLQVVKIKAIIEAKAETEKENTHTVNVNGAVWEQVEESWTDTRLKTLTKKVAVLEKEISAMKAKLKIPNGQRKIPCPHGYKDWDMCPVCCY